MSTPYRHERDLSRIGPDDLPHIDDDTFHDVVNADLRRRDFETTLSLLTSAALRRKENIERWRAALERMALGVDGQLRSQAERYESKRATLRRDLILAELALQQASSPTERSAKQQMVAEVKASVEELRAEYLHRKAGKLRFKTGLDQGMSDANYNYAKLFGVTLDKDQAAESERLSDAIRLHRDAMEREDLEPTEIDEALWRALDSIH